MEELNIGKKIQDFRNASNTSVRELSKKSGITASMLSQIETWSCKSINKYIKIYS